MIKTFNFDMANEIKSRIYYDPSEYGSMKETTKDAKSIHSSITFSDVKAWFDNRVKSKSKVKGASSFVANGPYQ